MTQPLDIQIRGKLADYLAGDISLDELEDWFVPASWNVRQTGTAQAAVLVYEIELRLAEYSNDQWTEDDLRSFLRPLAETYWAFTGDVTTGVTTPEVTTAPMVLHLGVAAGISPAGASA